MSKANNESPSEFLNELPAERQMPMLRGLYDMAITMLNEKDAEIEALKAEKAELQEEIEKLCYGD